jgi:hypothetical protein
MAVWHTALLIALLLFATDRGVAQDVVDFADSHLTREQWQQRLDEARRRSEEFVAKARTLSSEPLITEREQAEVADQRAVHDQTLQQGDIISTSRGFLVFTGRADPRGAFVPLTSSASPSKDRQPPGAIK